MSGSKAKQYPPQTGDYAVKVKNGAGWQDFDTARLQISVGQPYHEDEKFEATLKWASMRFDKVIVCVNDTLQRFNLIAEGHSEDEAQRMTLDMGREWIERNLNLLRTLPNVEIKRWDSWKKDDYAEVKQQIDDLYYNNIEFQVAVDTDVTGFTKRNKTNPKLCREYLREETAVFSKMFRERAVDIYPGSVLLPCRIFQGRDVEGAPDGLSDGHFTRIDFRRNHQPLPKVA